MPSNRGGRAILVPGRDEKGLVRSNIAVFRRGFLEK